VRALIGPFDHEGWQEPPVTVTHTPDGPARSAGWYSLKGNGEMTGTIAIDETGSLNLLVVLSNTRGRRLRHRGPQLGQPGQPAARPASEVVQAVEEAVRRGFPHARLLALLGHTT
jgi:hypothetical protein